MNNFTIRDFRLWYGPTDLDFEEAMPAPWPQLAKILINFKKGNFCQREELFDLCCKFRDEKVGIFGLQLFFLTARPVDIELISQYTEDATDVELIRISNFLLDSLVVHPAARVFLETVFRIRDNTAKQRIVSHLKSMLPISVHETIVGDVSGSIILNEIDKNLSRNIMFYFRGQPAFLGNIAISLQRYMQISIGLDPPGILGDGTGPTLLSAASGLECPVSYATVMTPDKVKAVLDYIKAISAMGKAMGGWKRGAKYFYGHEIV
jgi:hypothetical protein